MTLRDQLLPIVESARRLTGSTQLDQRPTKVVRRIRRWLGERVGDEDGGGWTDTDLEFPQHYKVTELGVDASEKVVGSGGSYSMGDVVKFVVTPKHGCAGYTVDQLDPKAPEGVERNHFQVFYILSGAVNGEYAVGGIKSDRPYRIEVFLVRRNTTP